MHPLGKPEIPVAPDTVPTVIGCRCDQVATASEFGIRQAGRPAGSGRSARVNPARGRRFAAAAPGEAIDLCDPPRVDPDVLKKFAAMVQDGTVKRFGTSKAGV